MLFSMLNVALSSITFKIFRLGSLALAFTKPFMLSQTVWSRKISFDVYLFWGKSYKSFKNLYRTKQQKWLLIANKIPASSVCEWLMIMKFGRSLETVFIRLCTKSGENRPLDCTVKLIKVISAIIKKNDLASEPFHAHVHIHFISLPLLLTLTCHKPFARYIIF